MPAITAVSSASVQPAIATQTQGALTTREQAVLKREADTSQREQGILETQIKVDVEVSTQLAPARNALQIQFDQELAERKNNLGKGYDEAVAINKAQCKKQLHNLLYTKEANAKNNVETQAALIQQEGENRAKATGEQELANKIALAEHDAKRELITVQAEERDIENRLSSILVELSAKDAVPMFAGSYSGGKMGPELEAERKNV